MWERLAPLLPPQKPRTGCPALDHRRFLEAVLWLARTGAPWRDLPPELMNWRTACSAAVEDPLHRHRRPRRPATRRPDPAGLGQLRLPSVTPRPLAAWSAALVRAAIRARPLASSEKRVAGTLPAGNAGRCVMADVHAERRLAAILAADVVGYSRLIEQDEAATLAALKGLRQQVIDPLLAEHKGRIVKLMGEAPHPCSSWPRGCACGSPPP